MEVSRVVAAVCSAVCSLGIAAAQQSIPPIQLAPPGDTGRRITEDGLLANYYPAQREAAAILLLGGSVGGLSPLTNDIAKALQAEGFTTLHLSYYRGPGQSARLELIPLEYFASALAWLSRQPEVDRARMGIVGGSKGAEAALLVAVRHPELKAVVVAAPSSVVWPGVFWEGGDGPIDSSWSEAGKPVPDLPHPPYDPRKGGTTTDNLTSALATLPQHPEAAIPVERIRGRVLLVCGEADRLWPSCPMARQVEARLREHHRPAATLLAYADAGHIAFGLPLPLDDPRLTGQGGTAQGTSAARADSWPKALAFLKAHLGN
jgi:uncharacterized protein